MVFGRGENDTQLLDTFAKNPAGIYFSNGPVAGSQPWLTLCKIRVMRPVQLPLSRLWKRRRRSNGLTSLHPWQTS